MDYQKPKTLDEIIVFDKSFVETPNENKETKLRN